MNQQPMEQQEAPGAATVASPAAPPVAPAVPLTALKVVKQDVPSPSPLMRHTRRCNGRQVCNCMLRVESALFHKNLVEKALKKRRAAAGAGDVVQKQATDGGDDEEKAPAKEPVAPRRMSLRVRAASVNRESKLEPPATAKHTQKKQKTKQKKASGAKAKRLTKRYVAVTRLDQFDFDIKLLIASFVPPVSLAMLGMVSRWQMGRKARPGGLTHELLTCRRTTRGRARWSAWPSTRRASF